MTKSVDSDSSTGPGTEMSTLPCPDDACKAQPGAPVSDSSTVDSPYDDDDDDDGGSQPDED